MFTSVLKTSLLTGLAAASIISAPALAEDLPKPTAEYVGKVKMLNGRGKLSEISVRARAAKIRFDIPAGFSGGDGPMAMIMNFQSGETLLFPTGKKVSPDERIAMKFAANHIPTDQGFVPSLLQEGTATGKGSYVGETCTYYDVPQLSSSGEVDIQSACLSADGVMLFIDSKTTKPVDYEMMKIKRSPQPNVLFSAPPGYQVMYMGSFTPTTNKKKKSFLQQTMDEFVDDAKQDAKHETKKKRRSLFDKIF